MAYSGILRSELQRLLGAEAANEMLTTPAGTASVTALTGSPGTVTTVQAALAELYANAVSAQGFILLPLDRFRLISSNDIAASGAADGGTLSSNTAPKLIRINAATDKGQRILWAASSVAEIATTFVYPPDMDESTTYTVNLRCKMAGASDTPVIGIGVFENIGGSDVGGNTAALSSTLATKSATVSPVGPFPAFASINLTPAAHGTDALELYAAYITYKKKILTS